jgi:hypothetical protein
VAAGAPLKIARTELMVRQRRFSAPGTRMHVNFNVLSWRGREPSGAGRTVGAVRWVFLGDADRGVSIS